MADQTPNPTPIPGPTPDPILPAPPKLGLPGALAALAVVAALAFAGYEAYRKFDPRPTPLPPAPAPDAPARATVAGLFWPAPPAGIRGTDPAAPLGMFRLDAGGSESTGAIRWKRKGPALKLQVFSPEGSLAGSIAEGYPTEPGTYTFYAIARGTAGGEPDADVDAWTCTIESPRPPDPTPGPHPDPTPGPHPDPTPGPHPDPTPGPHPDPTPGPTPPGPRPLPGPGPIPPGPAPSPKPFPSTANHAGAAPIG